MPYITRRGTLALAITLATPATILAAPALAQGRYPNRPIRFLIPWAPGGSLDALHRVMLEAAGRDLASPS